jgi:hypothetical protein
MHSRACARFQIAPYIANLWVSWSYIWSQKVVSAYAHHMLYELFLHSFMSFCAALLVCYDTWHMDVLSCRTVSLGLLVHRRRQAVAYQWSSASRWYDSPELSMRLSWSISSWTIVPRNSGRWVGKELGFLGWLAELQTTSEFWRSWCTGKLLKEWMAGGFYNIWMANAFKKTSGQCLKIYGGQCFEY